MNHPFSELPASLASLSNRRTISARRRSQRSLVAALALLCAAPSLVAQAPVAQSAFAQYLSTQATVVGTANVAGASGTYGDGGAAKSALLNVPSCVAYDAQGNLYIADSTENTVRMVNTAGNISLVAGNYTQGFSGDTGPATSAQLYAPNSVYVDTAGNVYIADTSNNRIREVAAGTGIINTIVGNATSGVTANGLTGPKTEISLPKNVWLDPMGNVYYSGNNYVRVLLVSNPFAGQVTGTVYSVVGTNVATDTGDGGPVSAATIDGPRFGGITARGDYLIVDKVYNETRIVPSLPYGSMTPGNIYDFAGVNFNGTGTYMGDGGPATNATLNGPNAVVSDAFGNAFIADTANNVFRVVDKSTGNISTLNYIVNSSKLPGTASYWVTPDSIAFAPNGNFAVAETGTKTIRTSVFVNNLGTAPVGGSTASTSFTLQANIADTLSAPAITSGATPDFLIGLGGCPGGMMAALSVCTIPVAMTPTAPGLRIGQLVTTETSSGNKAVLPVLGIGTAPAVAITPAVISTIAGSGGNPGSSGNGSAATAALLSSPAGEAFDSVGNLYVVGSDNTVRVISPAGKISAFAGTGTAGNSGDGGPAAAATLNNPTAVAVDPSGNILIADTGNNAIREVSSENGIINTITYTNATPSIVTNGGANLLNGPRGVASDIIGNIYIADTGNNVVRKLIRGSGMYVTLAGNGTTGFSGDGAAASASVLSAPSGVFVDANSNIFIADTGNNRIREISGTTGIITTIAGSSISTSLGDGGLATSATLNGPRRVAEDAAGDIFIADTGNNRIREISAATGIITTIAGSGTATPFSGDGGAAIAATLNAPTGLALDAADNLYIGDTGNARIAKIAVSGVTFNLGGAQQGTTSAASNATLTNFGNATLTLSNIAFSAQFAQSFTTGNDCTSTTTLAPGASCLIGIVFSPTTTGTITGTATVSDNALNTASTQTIALTGNGTAAPAVITVAGGSGQTTNPDSAFATSLTAKVVDTTGAPVSAVTVTFTAPTTGATGTFPNGSNTVQEPTNAAGIATAMLTAGIPDGTFMVTASVTGIATPATFTETVSGLPKPALTLAYSPTTNPAVYGGVVTLTATLTPSTLGGNTETKTVTFSDNGNVLGTGNVTNGQATYVFTPGAATHNFTAAYSGDANFAPSATTTAVTLVVVPLSITAAANSTSFTYGSPLPVITGKPIGILPADTANVTAIFTGITAIGNNTPIVSASPVGVYPILTTLTGSAAANYTVASTTGTVTITQATSTLTLNYSPKNYGSATAITLTATVLPQFSGTPSGTVTYTDVVNGVPALAPLGTSKASSTGTTLVVTLSTLGTHVITATFPNSTNLSGSSATITLTIVNPTFTTTQAGTTVSVVQGGTALMAFTYAATGGFTSLTTFSCSGLPANATCTVNPPSFTPAGTIANSTGSGLVSIQTAGPGLGFTSSLKHPAGLGGEHRMLYTAFGSLPGFALLLLGFRRGRKTRRKLAAHALLLLLSVGVMLQISGCGGNISAPLVAQYTPVGTSTITITSTAAGATVSSFNYTLNVTAAP